MRVRLWSSSSSRDLSLERSRRKRSMASDQAPTIAKVTARKVISGRREVGMATTKVRQGDRSVVRAERERWPIQRRWRERCDPPWGGAGIKKRTQAIRCRGPESPGFAQLPTHTVGLPPHQGPPLGFNRPAEGGLAASKRGRWTRKNQQVMRTLRSNIAGFSLIPSASRCSRH